MEIQLEPVTDTRDAYCDVPNRQIIVGAPALDYHLETGGHPADIVSVDELARSLVSKRNTGLGKPNTAKRRALDRDRAISDGRIILDILQTAGVRTGLTNLVLIQAWDMGLMEYTPNQIRTERNFRSIVNFEEAVGQEKIFRKFHFDDLTIEDLVAYIRQMYMDDGQKPTIKTMVEKANADNSMGIHPAIIRRILKKHDSNLTIYDLYEMAGCSETSHAWSDKKIEAFSVDYMWANRGRVPTATALNLLSRTNRSPSSSGIVGRYETIRAYQETVSTAFQTTIDERLRQIEIGVVKGEMPAAILTSSRTVWELLIKHMKYELVDSAASDIDESDKLVITGWIGQRENQIKASYPQIDIESLKEEARLKGFFSAIWPKQSGLYVRYNRYTESQIPAAINGSASKRPSLKLLSNKSQEVNRARQYLYSKTDEQRSDFLASRGAEIQDAIRSGTVPFELFKGSKSGTNMIERYEMYQVLGELLPEVMAKERVRICIVGGSVEAVGRIIQKFNPKLGAENLHNLGILLGYPTLLQGSRV